MSWTNPPDTLTGLRLALIGTAAWLAEFSGNVTNATAAVHYPAALPSDTFPLALLEMKDSRNAKITIIGVYTVGALQQLARQIAFQIMSRYRSDGTGLVIAEEPQIGEVGEPSDYTQSGGDATSAIEITVPYGINL